MRYGGGWRMIAYPTANCSRMRGEFCGESVDLVDRIMWRIVKVEEAKTGLEVLVFSR
jgi:hypothetical protein